LAAFSLEHDRSVEIDRLQSALAEKPGDVLKLIELAELQNHADPVAAHETWAEVERLCRRRLEISDDAAVLDQWAEALAALDRPDEAESKFRRATEIAPRDWKTWAVLGNFLQDRASAALTPGGQAKRAQPPVNPPSQELLDCRPTGDAMEKCAADLQSADQCLRRAVSLAPGNANARLQLALNLCLSNWISHLITHYRGEDSPALDAAGWTRAFLCPAGVAELRRADQASSDPTLLAATGILIMFEQSAGAVKPSSELLRQSIYGEILHLQNLAAQSDPKRSADALMSLSFIESYLGDKIGARRAAREALSKDSSLDSAWELLAGWSVDAVSPGEFVNLCETRLKQTDTERNRLFLAQAYLRLKKPDKAEEQAQAIISAETNNFAACVIQLVADLQRSDDPQYLSAAGQDLLRATDCYKEMAPGAQSFERWRELSLNGAIWNGLQDGPEYQEVARNSVEAVLRQRPDDQTAKDILRALR
jgi:tetratricopeptide (TPR) repeat protein